MRTAIKKVQFLLIQALLLCLFGPLAAHAQIIPLPNAFAHNDYWHERPLYDALQNGYTHVEADVFLINGEMVVAHLFPFFQGERTLENLYLRPLSQLVKKQGAVFAGYDTPLTLMIDIKTGAESTYAALRPLLEKYKSILSSYENGKVHTRMVTIVLSGNKPYKAIKAEAYRLAFIDQDLRDINKDNCCEEVYPMASCKYSSLVSWQGNGAMPAKQRNRLMGYVRKAHSMGKKVRLWASPERENVWDELLRCGVDLINTDQLVTLKNYLSNTTYANRTETANLAK